MEAPPRSSTPATMPLRRAPPSAALSSTGAPCSICPGGTPTQYSSVAGNPHIRLHRVLLPSSSFRMTSSFSPNFTLSAGLRYFYANHPFQDNGITPRLGVAWAPGGSKTLKLSAHLGLFSGHSPNGSAGYRRPSFSAKTAPTASPRSSITPLTGIPDTTSGSSVIHAVRTLELLVIRATTQPLHRSEETRPCHSASPSAPTSSTCEAGTRSAP